MTYDKVVVIISSDNREKVLTAIMYAKNTINYGWMNDVKVIFFGPSERLLTMDEQVSMEAKALLEITEPIVCKFIADRDDITEAISSLGLRVEYVGSVIADLLKLGYVPMVW